MKDDLSRYLRQAAKEDIVITRHGKAAGVLIGFESEDDWSDYRLENDPRFLDRIAAARAGLRAGRGVLLAIPLSRSLSPSLSLRLRKAQATATAEAEFSGSPLSPSLSPDLRKAQATATAEAEYFRIPLSPSLSRSLSLRLGGFGRLRLRLRLRLSSPDPPSAVARAVASAFALPGQTSPASTCAASPRR